MDTIIAKAAPTQENWNPLIPPDNHPVAGEIQLVALSRIALFRGGRFSLEETVYLRAPISSGYRKRAAPQTNPSGHSGRLKIFANFPDRPSIFSERDSRSCFKNAHLLRAKPLISRKRVGSSRLSPLLRTARPLS